VDFMLALNVTIYGLGIVFLALLALMVAIMLLTKLFSMATGKDILEVPGLTPASAPAAPLPAEAPGAPLPVATGATEAVTAPLPGKILSVAVQAGDRVRKGDELCVIEAMKMGNSVKAPRDGVVAEVSVAAGTTVPFGAPLVLLAATAASASAPLPAPAPAATPGPAAAQDGRPVSLTLTVAGVPHAAEVTPGAAGAASVRLDGARFEARRDPADGTRILVNGQAHTVEVKELAGGSATLLIDGTARKVEVSRQASAAPVAFTLGHPGRPRAVEVAGTTVRLDGASFQVERDSTDPARILVNGQAHTVEVKELAGGSATLLIDGRVERLEVARQAVSAPAQPAPPNAASVAPPTPIPASTTAASERVTAPLPGKILSVAVKAGDRVKKGDELCVIEAMKMGNSIRAQRDGTVREILIAAGLTVPFGAPLLVLD
jgi:glutaconyl-CoA/methylmalonyl-CoA decarboxylase subunit gamma